MSTHLVFCTGANGTGKTATLNALMDVADTWLEQVVPHSSIIRGFSQSQGLSTESDVEELSASQGLEYQLALYRYYWEQVRARIVSGRVNVFERSPTCHLAHVLMYASRVQTSREDVTKWISESITGIQDLAAQYDTTPRLVLFPFPTSWYSVAHAVDEYRSVGYAKNLVLDSLIQRLRGTIFPAEIHATKTLISDFPATVRASVLLAHMKDWVAS